MKNFGVLAGIILGMVAVSLGFYFINKIAFKGNDITKALPAYINNSVKLKVTVPEADPKHVTGQFDFNFKTYKKNIRADKNGDVCQILFFSKEYSKYFNILLYDDRRADDGIIVLNISEQQVTITVNKDDLSNSKYGSKVNPIPVFRFDIIAPKNENSLLHITEQQYSYNVTQYLTYVMPKEEFKKRFGK